MAMLWLIPLIAALTWREGYAAEEKCIAGLGCFGTGGEFFDLLRRPLFLLPDDREVIGTTFLLYTRQNPRVPRHLDDRNKESVTESTFNPSRHTKVIIHGFMDNQLFGQWMQDMKDQLLILDDFNVIVVDWSGGNKPPYAQATVNTRVVGAEVALILSVMQEWVGLQLSNVHVIGHSLGAHICGYAGKRLENLERITGLDPAEPYFQGMSPIVRLDRADAKFVDIIHSDAKTILLLGFGMSQPIGHLDFFPNDGRNQPGCKTDQVTKFITAGIGEGFRRFVSCNHQRAIDFFSDSINHHECTFIGYVCKNWHDFLDAKCTDCGPDGSKCAVMGLGAYHYAPKKNDSNSIVMYTSTGSSNPFCLQHFRVSLQLHKGDGKHKDTKGKITLAIRGAENKLTTTLGDSATDFYHGGKYNFIITTDHRLGRLLELSFSWKFGPSLNPLDLLKKHELYVEKVEVASMSHIDKETRDQLSKTFCHNPDEAILSNKEEKFTDC